jgi:hypothetical protein
MDQDALREVILDRTVAGDDQDDIIFDICEQTGMHWDTIESLVQRVVEEEQSQITLRQSPLLVLLALATFLGGWISLGVAAVKSYDFISGVLFTRNAFVTSVGVVVYLVEYLPYLAGWITVGVGMILGSLLGMQKIWEAIFDHFKISV